MARVRSSGTPARAPPGAGPPAPALLDAPSGAGASAGRAARGASGVATGAAGVAGGSELGGGGEDAGAE
eukprot:4326579-Alexandrium_andersonii.AAC.1